MARYDGFVNLKYDYGSIKITFMGGGQVQTKF